MAAHLADKRHYNYEPFNALLHTALERGHLVTRLVGHESIPPNERTASVLGVGDMERWTSVLNRSLKFSVVDRSMLALQPVIYALYGAVGKPATATVTRMWREGKPTIPIHPDHLPDVFKEGSGVAALGEHVRCVAKSRSLLGAGSEPERRGLLETAFNRTQDPLFNPALRDEFLYTHDVFGRAVTQFTEHSKALLDQYAHKAEVNTPDAAALEAQRITMPYLRGVTALTVTLITETAKAVARDGPAIFKNIKDLIQEYRELRRSDSEFPFKQTLDANQTEINAPVDSAAIRRDAADQLLGKQLVGWQLLALGQESPSREQIFATCTKRQRIADLEFIVQDKTLAEITHALFGGGKAYNLAQKHGAYLNNIPKTFSKLPSPFGQNLLARTCAALCWATTVNLFEQALPESEDKAENMALLKEILGIGGAQLYNEAQFRDNAQHITNPSQTLNGPLQAQGKTGAQKTSARIQKIVKSSVINGNDGWLVPENGVKASFVLVKSFVEGMKIYPKDGEKTWFEKLEGFF